jgi:hypothetical protein
MAGRGKRSTRNRAIREWRSAYHTQEGWRTLRYVATSAAQGDPRTMMQALAIVSGGALKLLAALAERSTNAHVAASAAPIDDTGDALWVLAAVDKGSQTATEVISAARGQPPTVAYDVSDAPHSEMAGGGGAYSGASFPAGNAGK